MDLQTQFNNLVKRHHWWCSEDTVVVAVSTGVDSMTLLHMLENLPENRPNIVVAYVDHQLRQASQQETCFIQRYCQQNNLALAQATWPKQQHPVNGIEAAARKFRYAFFRRVLVQYQSEILLTAHHGDDLAETMIMKLVRGGQLSSLIGIKQKRPFASATIIRPLLEFSKHELHDFAVMQHLQWFEDETNRSLKIERNRIRHQVLPLLKQENPQILKHVYDYSSQIQRVIATVDDLVKPIVDRVATVQAEAASVDLSQLVDYSNDVRLSIFEYLIQQQLGIHNVSQRQLRELSQLSVASDHPQGELYLEHGWRALRRYDQLIITKNLKNHRLESEIPSEFMVVLDRWYSVGNGVQFGVFKKLESIQNEKVSCLVLSKDDFPLIGRYGRSADRIRLKDGGHQKLRRLLINAKVPNELRHQTIVLATNQGDIVSMIGLKTAAIDPLKVGEPYFLLERANNNLSERKGIN